MRSIGLDGALPRTQTVATARFYQTAPEDLLDRDGGG